MTSVKLRFRDAPEPEVDQAVRFLDALHGPGAGRGDVVFTLLGSGRRQRNVGIPDWPGATLDGLVLDADVYVAPCRFAPGRPGAPDSRKQRDAVWVPGVWADLDVKPDQPEKPRSGDELERVLAALPAPTLLVGTNRTNRHAYWLFPEGLTDARRASRLTLGWIAHLSRLATQVLGRPIRFDSVQDLARVLRLPGLVRRPKGLSEAPVLVQLLAADGPRYPPDKVERAIPAEVVQRLETHRDAAASPVTVALDDPRLRLYVERAVASERDELGVTHANRNDRLNAASFSLGTLAAHGLLDRDVAYAALVEDACRRNGLWADPDDGPERTEGTFESGWEAGLARPRPLPRWMTEELTGPAELPVPLAYDDARVGEAFGRWISGRYLYCGALGGWLCWDGRRWRADETETVFEECRRYLLDLNGYLARQGAHGDDLRALARFYSKTKLEAVVTVARRLDWVAAGHDEFDRNPDLLNCANGVVDLRSGRLDPPDPDLRLTKLADTDYLPGATHPDLETCLEAVTPEVRDWLQVLFGYGLTGHVAEDVQPTFDGVGANGKTSLLGCVEATLGDYAGPAPVKLLMSGGREEHPTLVADLRGRRLVFVEETPEGGTLAIERMKALTGGSSLRARYMRQDYFTFVPTHLLVTATNHRPGVNATDYAT